ncbi:PiggyBac transposable element-derived protein 4 [Eumeta japonica]|uniref:PiggyBac transposable element-derived protein 4 n=1 Tax=Eumeta variegata TaxID=151549 RepID=A0A4C1U3H0_EUMVA|nr:PiggyBac transposable element-derived protein 4 [Eumeta japonica]
MGYNILPSMELYWSSDPAFRVDEIASTMPYRRFKLILRCLHLNDNSKQPLRSSPDYDKLFKIRPLVTLLNSTFQNNANNSSSQSIDESMIVFKGSSTGYLYEFDIYTGKDGDRVEDNLGAKVVTKLTEKLTGMGAVHDTKEVLFLTNAFHPNVNITSVTRTQKDGTKTDVGCPAVVKQYTKRMGGVDHFDHIKGTYSVGRRSRRWWLRIFYFLLDACITNAFILYSKNSNSTKLSNLEFRIALARGLIGGFSSRKRRSEGVNYIVRKKVAVSDNYQKSVHMIAPEIRFSNVGEHMPVDLPSYQRCRHCSTKIKDKRSKIMCCKCGVPLCITPCFLNFHRQAPA